MLPRRKNLAPKIIRFMSGPRRQSRIPQRKAKHVKSFALYIDGNEVYAKEVADALESDLQPMVGSELITRMSKHSTNPADNPQPPARLHT
jgi:hypothetical protein